MVSIEVRNMKLQSRVSYAVAFCLMVLLSTLPATAHLTEVSGDVAGTWHIEPNHSPKAGESAQVWVALTQRGGKIVPFDQCDCRLAVYEGNADGNAPLLRPALKAIAAENYQGIPGAEVIFPRVGQYQLELTGRPKPSASFQPFKLNYTVTVATESSSPIATSAPQPQAVAPASNAATPNQTETAQPSAAQFRVGKALIGLGGLITFCAAGIALYARKSAKQ